MNEMSIYYLICQYPSLKEFIISCVKERDLEKLWDFLHGLELDEELMYKAV